MTYGDYESFWAGRRRRLCSICMILAFAALAACVTPDGARAEVTISPTAPGAAIYQGWVSEARVPSPDREITVIEEGETPCVFALACSNGETIWLAVPQAFDKATFYHELGQVFNFAYLLHDPELQNQYLSLIGRRQKEWGWESGGGTWSGTEWFADSYMQCARLSRIDPSWGYHDGSGLLIGWRLRNVCGWLRRFPA